MTTTYEGLGVCSACPTIHAQRWDAGDRDFANGVLAMEDPDDERPF